MTGPFLIDAQLPRILAARLQSLGYSAIHVSAVAADDAADDVIWQIAERDGCVVVSKDEDFAQRVRASATGPSVVWIRLGNQPNAALWTALGPIWPDVCAVLDAGEHLVEVR
jgi:predicted nuclease of predicted toxin-antitoxin system